MKTIEQITPDIKEERLAAIIEGAKYVQIYEKEYMMETLRSSGTELSSDEIREFMPLVQKTYSFRPQKYVHLLQFRGQHYVMFYAYWGMDMWTRRLMSVAAFKDVTHFDYPSGWSNDKKWNLEIWGQLAAHLRSKTKSAN